MFDPTHMSVYSSSLLTCHLSIMIFLLFFLLFDHFSFHSITQRILVWQAVDDDNNKAFDGCISFVLVISLSPPHSLFCFTINFIFFPWRSNEMSRGRKQSTEITLQVFRNEHFAGMRDCFLSLQSPSSLRWFGCFFFGWYFLTFDLQTCFPPPPVSCVWPPVFYCRRKMCSVASDFPLQSHLLTLPTESVRCPVVTLMCRLNYLYLYVTCASLPPLQALRRVVIVVDFICRCWRG